jgi:hypothetical protein
MILILRGHIRESFNTKDLYNFVKELYTIFPNLNIYIHTWNIFANNISWRNIEINNNIVELSTIFNYFDDLKILIKKIIIDDDTKIKLIGNLNGNVALSKMPLKGWKNYWYGKYSIINYIYNTDIDKNKFVINTRFDLFCNSYNFNNIQIINFIKNNNKNVFIKNKFLVDKNRAGVDNIYIGNINTMYTLIHKFYYELDNILTIYNKITAQEYLVCQLNDNPINTKIPYNKALLLKQSYMKRLYKKY